MNIVFVANRIPFPPFRGDKLKIFNLARRLSSENKLFLLTFYQDTDELKYRLELEKIFDEVHLVYQPKWKSILHCIPAIFSGESFQIAYFKNKDFEALLSRFYANKQVDVTHVQHLRMSQYHQFIKGPKILDLPDAYSLYWERRKKIRRKWYNVLFDSIESKRVEKAEKIVHLFDLNLVCSIEDRDFLREKHQLHNVELLRNGVDLDLFVYRGHNYEKNDTLLFTGNMDYAPNVDAVTYFSLNIWPKLKKQFPSLKLVIAGQRPVNEVVALESNDIEVTGFVNDMSLMYEKASVVIAPLRFGAGTQNKVLEAMAMGVPVVCTEIGFKGLEIEDGEGCFLSMNDAAFVENTVKLLQNSALRKETGQKGLKVANDRFSWNGIAYQLEQYFKQLIEKNESA